MQSDSTIGWQHDHTFGQHERRAGERRTLIVLAITAIMMAVEIAAGAAFGSMALLADGLHMGSHAVAIGIAAMAYVYARRHASDPRFSFGTGKVNSLAGFTGAVLLAMFALLMAAKSVDRLVHPVAIGFDQALVVAVAGLLVNGLCGLLLHDGHDDGHHDHNLRSAYLHVLADALTSVLAIVALLSAKLLGAVWMDPVVGIVGAVLVARWSWGLLRQTSQVLLDHQAPAGVRESIREAIESRSRSRVLDLHVWSIGPGIYAAIIAVATDSPQSAEHYHGLLPGDLRVAHLSVEVRRWQQAEAASEDRFPA